MGRYSPEQKRGALEVLEASAEAHGKPKFAEVSRTTDVPSRTLRTWWKRHQALTPEERRAELTVHAGGKKKRPGKGMGPPVAHRPDVDPVDVLSWTSDQFMGWMLQQVIIDGQEAATAGVLHALPGLRKLGLEVWDRYAQAREEARGRSGDLSPEEQIQKIRQLVRAMPPKLRVVANEELQKLGFAAG